MRAWIKQNTNELNDLRFSSLSAEAERTYGRMYKLAGLLDAEGLFIEHGRVLSNDEIAYRIRLQTSELNKSIKELTKARLVHVNGKGPQIMDFKRDQVDLNTRREKDRERQARHRSVTRDEGVTSGDTHGSQSVTSLERERDSDLRKESLLLLSQANREKLAAHPEWIDEALKLAQSQNKPRASYVAGILRNWILEGRKPKGGKRATGHNTTGHSKPETKDPAPASDADLRTAARITARRKSNV